MIPCVKWRSLAGGRSSSSDSSIGSIDGRSSGGDCGYYEPDIRGPCPDVIAIVTDISSNQLVRLN